MPHKDTYYIYGLVCPIRNKVFYVGRTVDLTKRFDMHCRDIKGNSEKQRWAKHLADRGLKPRLAVLDVLEAEYALSWDKDAAEYPHLLDVCPGTISRQARESERHWVQKFHGDGHPLTNRRLITTPNERRTLDDAVALGKELATSLSEED